MQQPMQQPTPMTYLQLIPKIENGEIKIPQFQREFVWSVNKTAKLMDSLVKGYPIGSFIFWRTKDRFRMVRDLGGVKLPVPRKGELVNYVLDGQQRLASIFMCIKGLQLFSDDSKRALLGDYSEMYIDMEARAEKGEDVVVLEKSGNDDRYIRVQDLAEGSISHLSAYTKNYGNKVDKYRDNLRLYPFSVIEFNNADISVATDIFSRINVGGIPLTTFEIMVAKTHDSKKKFDLGEKFESLVEELDNVGYETITGETVLQVASAILKKDCRRRTILALPKDKFINKWGDIVSAITYAIDYFRTEYRIPVSRLLPYNPMLVPFAYFFHQNGNKLPDATARKMLCDFFWRNALLERYSSAVESNLGQDIKKMDNILGGKLPPQEDLSLTSGAIIANGKFSPSRSFVKAILCIYAALEPQSFKSGSKVIVGNDYLQRANSRNYHHFFPRAYLTKQGNHDEHMINNVLNITIVDENLNKKEIGAKKPSVYMGKFQKSNDDIHATMRTHLIDDLEKFGIFSDDYDTFLRRREARVIAEIRKRIIEK